MPDFPVLLVGRHAGPQTIRAIMNGQIVHALRPGLWWRQTVTLTDFTPDAATSQELDLNTLFTRNAFPANVDLEEGCIVRNVTLPAGGSITEVTVEVGDTGDPNGLLTASNVLGSGAAAGDILNTPAAAQYARRPETAFAPTLTINTTGGNVADLTAFEVEVLIPWTPRTAL